MRSILKVVFLAAMSVLAGCGPSIPKGDNYLVVDFQPDTVLRYNFVSERDIVINIDTPSRPDVKNSSHQMSEKLDMVIAYKPVKVDPFGLSIIEASCESVKVTRQSFTIKGSLPPDAVETLVGKTFTFQITPSGKIADYQPLIDAAAKAGAAAFVDDTGRAGRVKNPDMIYDFLAMQWYLWDAVATLKQPLEGITAGAAWNSVQFVPLPIQYPAARETSYTLTSTESTEAGRKALINCSYRLSPSPVQNWPEPYKGPYHLKGSLFAVLTNYRLLSMDGSGSQTFNIDSGKVESIEENYVTKIGASFILPLGDSTPNMTVSQKINIRLL